MFKTLRSQLIMSHVLPSLVIIPLMGLVLVYFLENWLILPSLKNQLADDAVVIAKIANAQPQIFSDALLSTSLLKNLELETNTRVMILDPDGVVLASNDSADYYRINQVLDNPGVAIAQEGAISKNIDFSRGLEGDVVDVFVPVIDQADGLEGIIRVSYRYLTITDQLMEVRMLIVGILSIGAILSAVLGFLLALNIGQPITQVTQAIFDLARGVRTDHLPERGPQEVKQLEQAANFLVSQLRDLEISRRQLLANLVHELGRPLGGLRTGIQVLRKGAKDDPEILEELLEGMEMETTILNRLLEDLSLLYDQVIGKLELKIETITLSEWLPSVLYSAEESAHQNGLRWEVEIPDTLPDVQIDPQRMNQVINNLTSNAIKYTPSGGTVSISAGESEEMVWIRVSDTGPGVPVEEQEDIFEPFYRGTQSNRIKQGMGLGLNIAKDFVTAHQGSLQVESEPGLGSKFTIWLPKIVDVQHLSSISQFRTD